MKGDAVSVYRTGLPAGERSMPTCGFCLRQIDPRSTWAVSRQDGFELSEVRHVGDCETWRLGYVGADLAVGDLLSTHRYAVCEWGGRILARMVGRTEEFNDRGWRGWVLEPADPRDTSPLDGLRRTGNEGLIRLADRIGSIDPTPRRVWLPDEELIHHKREA